MGKKILGLVFVFIGVLLSISAIVQLPSFVFVIVEQIKESDDTYEYGYIFGQVFYWFIHLAIIFVLLKFGIRWLFNAKS